MAIAYQDYYTVEDYQSWQGDWELIAGMPYAMTPSPSVTHQAVGLNIAAQLKQNLADGPHDCGGCSVLMETDWQVSNDTVVRPDVMVICQEVGEKVVVTPELIVEVVSSSSTRRDEVMKFELYQQEGVLFYILLYPDNRLAKVYHNDVGGFRKTADYGNEIAEFTFKRCGFPIDFSTVWR